MAGNTATGGGDIPENPENHDIKFLTKLNNIPSETCSSLREMTGGDSRITLTTLTKWAGRECFDGCLGT